MYLPTGNDAMAPFAVSVLASMLTERVVSPQMPPGAPSADASPGLRTTDARGLVMQACEHISNP